MFSVGLPNFFSPPEVNHLLLVTLVILVTDRQTDDKGLLQCSTGRLTTDYDRTTSASTKRRGTPGLRVGSKEVRHSVSSPTALAACPLAHPVQTVLHYAFSFQRQVPSVFISRPCLRLRHHHQLTTCYHDFTPSSASTPFLTLVRLHGTDCLKTFAQNLTLQTFESFSKLIISVDVFLPVHCVMHP